MFWLLPSLALAQPCWDVGGVNWVPPPISAGYEASQNLGEGNLQVDCLGGVVTSAGGSPRWEAMLVSEGGDNKTYPVTYLVNSSDPYHARVFNTESGTKWRLVFHNYNSVRQMTVNVTYVIRLSSEPFPIPPPVPPIEYDDATARVAVVYSAAAYAVPENIKEWNLNASCMAATKDFSLQHIYDGQNKSIFTPFGYVGIDYERQWIVVAFKGTNGTKDTVADLIQLFSGASYYQTVCEINEHLTGNTHAGFCSYYKTLQSLGLTNDVLQLMQQYIGFAVMVTGHSLGGAIATLFHADLISTLQSRNPAWVYRVVCYTFGQPRVGDSGLAHNLPRIFRVVHADDCVPHLVPCCASGTSCQRVKTCPYHASQEVWYPQVLMSANNFTACDAADGEDPTCSNSQSVPMSVNNHLYYFGVLVGSYCYDPASFASHQRLEKETSTWLQSLSTRERKERTAQLSLTLNGKTL